MQARIRNTTPSGRIRNVVPSTRTSNFQTGRAGENQILPGTPIGLLLVLTYAAVVSPASYGEFRPTVRIA